MIKTNHTVGRSFLNCEQMLCVVALVYSWSDDCSRPQNPRLTLFYHDSVPVYSLGRKWNQSYCSGVCVSVCAYCEKY